MSKTCLECGEFFQGRTDKKFCGDFCRNVFNNRIKASASEYYRKVNSTLRRNYKILGELFPGDATETSKSQLLQKGFNFEYYTNSYCTKKGTHYYCYEYGYVPTEEDQYVLIKKQK